MAEHLNDPAVRLIEVDLDPEQAYLVSHLPGAVLWSLWGDLLGPDERLIDDSDALERLLSRSGVRPDATIILYGDLWNWGATLAFWVLHSIGHHDPRVMDGGRDKWLTEGRPTETEPPAVAPTAYPVGPVVWSERAVLADVRAANDSTRTTVLDVRLPEEYDGILFRPGAEPTEGQRAGHIPGSIHLPWEMTINEDGTFKALEDLRSLYRLGSVETSCEVIPYCTVGGRSSHTWFVLTQLLSYPNVRLYDASWAEWGQTPGLPIA